MARKFSTKQIRTAIDQLPKRSWRALGRALKCDDQTARTKVKENKELYAYWMDDPTKAGKDTGEDLSTLADRMLRETLLKGGSTAKMQAIAAIRREEAAKKSLDEGMFSMAELAEMQNMMIEWAQGGYDKDLPGRDQNDIAETRARLAAKVFAGTVEAEEWKINGKQRRA